ncbi:MAG: AhpC/TSA family protein [Acidimicrobiales bacterium]
MPCASHAVAVRDRFDEFGRDVEVAIITFASPERLISYSDRAALPFAVLRDPDRAGYRAFGLGRTSLTRVWGLRAAKSYIDVFRSRGLDGVRDVRVPTDDTRQLGGDFVIAPDGSLAWGFWGEGPDDRPAVDDLVMAASHARGDTEQS